jgi:uncharacterized phage protein (TIGR02216 family)
MGFGFGVLRLPPQAFWGVTLKELSAAMWAVLPDAAKTLERESFRELMRRYPD